MSSKQNTTVIVTTYNRYRLLGSILEHWLDETPNVILANGGKWFKTDLPITQILFKPDPGNKIRFVAAQIAKTEYVALADDDVVPKPGFLNDLYVGQAICGGDFVGIIGRKFTCDEYFKCPFIRSSKVKEPVEVGFIGVVYFTRKENTCFDLRGIYHRAIDDLYWQMKVFPQMTKFVVPSVNYANLKPECNEATSIFKDPKSKAERQAFYKKHYQNCKGGL